MSEYIEREAALSFLRKCQVFKFEGNLPDGRICHFSDVRQGVADIPAADVEPVKHECREGELKDLTLWKDDFARKRDWDALCDALGIDKGTVELEIRCLVCTAKDHYTRGHEPAAVE